MSKRYTDPLEDAVNLHKSLLDRKVSAKKTMLYHEDYFSGLDYAIRMVEIYFPEVLDHTPKVLNKEEGK